MPLCYSTNTSKKYGEKIVEKKNSIESSLASKKSLSGRNERDKRGSMKDDTSSLSSHNQNKQSNTNSNND